MCMYVFAWVVCMPQIHMCAGPSGGQKRGSDTLELKLQEIMSLLMWVGAGNSGPLQKQFTFLTTGPSLHPLIS